MMIETTSTKFTKWEIAPTNNAKNVAPTNI